MDYSEAEGGVEVVFVAAWAHGTAAGSWRRQVLRGRSQGSGGSGNSRSTRVLRIVGLDGKGIEDEGGVACELRPAVTSEKKFLNIERTINDFSALEQTEFSTVRCDYCCWWDLFLAL